MLASIGVVIVLLGGTMFIPAIVDWQMHNPDWITFTISGGITIFLGGGFFFATRTETQEWSRKNIIIYVNLLWVLAGIFSALPFIESQYKMSPVDAVFEAVSAITTTGSTVMTGLDDTAPGLLVWRSLLQWIGGVGIVLISVLVLPLSGVGSQALFYMETSDISEKPYARMQDYVFKIVGIYVFLTLSCALLYYQFGMSVFDAINHSLTTISTGGFSTHDNSMGYFHSNSILVTSTIFMVLGGFPFLFLIRVFSRQWIWDEQIEYFILISLILSGLVFIFLPSEFEGGKIDGLVKSIFNVVSIVTTTGYASEDYLKWGSFIASIFFVATFLGACSGSTSGGFKQSRIIISKSLIKQNVLKLQKPNRIIPIVYNGQVVNDDALSSMIGFTFLYFATFSGFAILLNALGLDFQTSISASATSLANVGPGIGDLIGPSGNFQNLTDLEKILLSWEMILGRLEIIVGYAVFFPSLWRS